MERIKSIINDLPIEITTSVTKMFEEIPSSSMSICVVCNESIRREASIIVEQLKHDNTLNNYSFKLAALKNDDNIEQQIEIVQSVYYILVLDSTSLFKSSDVAFLDYISRNDSIKHCAQILVIKSENIPSPLELNRTIETVLQCKNLNIPFLNVNNDNNVNDWCKQNIVNTNINMSNIVKERYEKILEFVKNHISTSIDGLSTQIKELEDRKLKFNENKNSFITRCNQLNVTLWDKCKTYSDENFDKNISCFAESLLNEIDTQLSFIDPKQITYYYAPYINYLWKQFLTYEVEKAVVSIKEELNNSIDNLINIYSSYFNQQITIDELTSNMISPGSQIALGHITTEHPMNNILTNVISTAVRFILFIKLPFVVAFISNIIQTKIISGIINAIGIEYSNDELRRLYSDETYTQFKDEALEDVKIQLKEALMPASENILGKSIEQVLSSFKEKINVLENDNTKTLEQLEQKKRMLCSKIEKIILLSD